MASLIEDFVLMGGDSIDNTKPRSQAMKLLADAGIYVLVVSIPPYATTRLTTPVSLHADDMHPTQ